MKIKISIAPSRKAKAWTNVTWEWSQLVDKCRETIRTGETVAEYAKMDRETQSNRKDVGGFVGGYLNDGLRRNGHVRFRSVATLDIDHGKTDVWEDFTMNFSCAAFLYSTHKHTEKAPRYRLVIPFSREVEPWEYEPVCRRIAFTLGLDLFDHTTYELPRLFYWPSSPTDAEYVFHEQKGEPIDVDAILATYTDPKDASEWPYGNTEDKVLRKERQKAGNPCEKEGLIGAFCRAYTIEEAVDTFLLDVYEPTTQEGRYTYRKGSVSGGLVCYSHQFAYSHHDTDPMCGKLCNAFDIVRIHKFGIMDEDKDEGTEVTKLPSYVEMMRFAGADKKTNVEVMKDRRAKIEEDFRDMENDEDGSEVLSRLDRDSKGNVRQSINNVIVAIKGDPHLRGKLWHDKFTGYDCASDKMPWNRTTKAWTDMDDANLRAYLERVYGLTGKERINDALSAVFADNQRHPIEEYLRGLTWDGVPRLDKLIIDYIGAEDTLLTRMMTRKIFTAAVARVMHPGTKFDYCLIMSGGEGIGKSTLLSTMGGDWFSDSIVTTEGKEGMESLRGAWIIELAELASIKRSDVEQVKNFLSKREDVYRQAYGKRVQPYPRQCVFFGTTNEDDFLKGDTGNRRFWVVRVDASKCSFKDPFKAIREDRDQLWAEAMVRFNENETLYLDPDMEKEARIRQQEANIDNDDPIPGMLDEYLSTLLPADWYTKEKAHRRAFIQNPDPLASETLKRTKFFAGEFVYEQLGMSENAKEYPYALRKVNKLMRKMEGWSVGRVRVAGYGRQRGWVLKGFKGEDE